MLQKQKVNVTCSPFLAIGIPPLLVGNLGDIFALDLGVDHLSMRFSILVEFMDRGGLKSEISILWGDREGEEGTTEERKRGEKEGNKRNLVHYRG